MSTEQKKAKLAQYRKESPRCSFIKKDGLQCRGIASNKTGKCPSHSGFVPQLARKRVDLTVSSDLVSLKKFLCRVAMDVQRGKLQPTVGNSLSNMVNVIIKVEEDLDVKIRIEELREMLEQFKSNDAGYDDLRALESEFEKQ